MVDLVADMKVDMEVELMVGKVVNRVAHMVADMDFSIIFWAFLGFLYFPVNIFNFLVKYFEFFSEMFCISW